MALRITLRSLLTLFLFGFIGLLRGAPEDDPAERVAVLVAMLGDSSFATRERAARAIETLGEQALPSLRIAENNQSDPEIRQNVRRLIRTIMMSMRTSKATGLEMTLIDSRITFIGTPREDRNWRDGEIQHRVRITQPYLLGVYEVTQQQYEQVMKNNPSWFTQTGKGNEKAAGMNTSHFPVEQVTWYDAIEFCNRLSQLDGYPPYYKLVDGWREQDSPDVADVSILGGNGYRLPTEAEWEHACRAGSTAPFNFGNAITGRVVNCRPGQPIGYGGVPNWQPLERTARVGSYAPNPFGLYDMHGNVAEWCWDFYQRGYYVRSPLDDPRGPDAGNQRVLRGGSWDVTEGYCCSAYRTGSTPSEANSGLGFRVCRNP